MCCSEDYKCFLVRHKTDKLRAFRHFANLRTSDVFDTCNSKTMFLSARDAEHIVILPVKKQEKSIILNVK